MSEALTGKVYLVGAGPGDPALITVRGRECLARADLVVYDALTHPDLLRIAVHAEHVFAGKKSDLHSLPQEDIHRILIDAARRGACVVRLKGGDPCIFGRGGEEALALEAAGIPFEIVPGVSAASGAAAYAGIPLTHRGLSGSVSFITGHAVGPGTPAVSLDQLAVEGTLVFYMGVKALPTLVEELLRLGRAPDTPAAVIEWGTYARQRTVTGTLDSIAARCRAAQIGPPSVTIVGPVAALRERLAWFESRPLFGLRAAVTHAAQRQGPLEDRLRDLGADVFSFPMLEMATADPVDETALEGLLQGAYDWLLLSSVNAVAAVFDFLDRRELDARALAGLRLCAVGPAAVSALRQRHLRVDAAPETYAPPAVISALGAAGGLAGGRILLPRSDVSRSALADALRAVGTTVTETAAYRTQLPADAADRFAALLAFKPDLIIFTNSAAVRNFARVFRGESHKEDLHRIAFASLGPVTSQAAAEEGFNVDVEAPIHEIPHLIEAICAWHAARRST